MQVPAAQSTDQNRVDLDIKLPPMPFTLSEVLKMRTDDNPDVDHLITIVRRDPAIIANVLRRVNSAYYGLGRKVSEVDKAITLLGYREVFGIVLTAAMKQTFTFRGTAESKGIYQHVMKTSVATAVIAKRLAQELTKLNVETAFTAGLLHQIGRLVILYSAPKAYTELWMRIAPAEPENALVAPSTEMEQFLFNTSYVQIGNSLAQEWDLPPEMCAVLSHHRDPAGVTNPYQRKLTFACAVAVETAASLFEPGDHLPTIRSLVEGLMPMHTAQVEPFVEMIRRESEDARRFAEEMLQD